MVISDSERKVLLERLEKARQAKVAKREAALAEKKAAEKPREAEIPPTPVIEPQPQPAPEPPKEELPPPNLLAKASEEEEIKLPPKIKKGRAKKVIESDEESMEDEPIKKTKKKTAYMKIKIYKEPTNPVAFNNLLEALNDTELDPEAEYKTSKPIAIQAPAPVQHRVVAGSQAKEQKVRENQARLMAMSFFQ